MGCTYTYKGQVFYSKEELADHIDSLDDLRMEREYPRSYPMSAPLYGGTSATGTDEGFFYARSYNPEELASGKKSISIRPENLQAGTYKFGENYFKITKRGYMKLNQMKETPENVRLRSLGDSTIKFAHIEEFFNNKVPMYVYDIKKLASSGNATYTMAADFMGEMKVKAEPGLVTGKGIFDEYISALQDYITRIKEERKLVKGDRKKVQDYTERIESQEKVLNSMKANKSIRFMVETGITQMEMAKLHGLREGASMLELNESLRLAASWRNITDLVDIAREGKSDDQLELIEKTRDLQNSAVVLYNDIMGKLINRIVATAAQNEINMASILDKNGNIIIKDIGAFGAQAISGAFSENQLEQLVEAVSAKQDGLAREELYDFYKESEDKLFDTFGSRRADAESITEEYEDTMFDESTGKTVSVKRSGIITMYSRSFYDELESKYAEAITTGKWKPYYEFEQQYFDYTLTDEGQKAFEDYMTEVRAEHIIETDNVTGEFIYDEDAIKEIYDRYDPEVFKQYLESRKGNKKIKVNSGAAWFTKQPKSNIPINPNYAKLSDKEKEFHSWFSEKFITTYENSVFDFRIGEIDMDKALLDFSANMVDGLGNRMKHMGGSVLNFTKNLVTRVATSTKSGNVARVLTNQQHIKVPYKNVAEFMPASGKVNPMEILTKVMEASIAFRRKREVEELFNTINDIVKISAKQETNNADSAIKRMSGAPLLTKGATNLSFRLEATIEGYLKDTFAADRLIAGKKAPGERGFSVDQAADTINSFTRLRYMALSPISATGNLIMAFVNNVSYASMGVYFTDKELAIAASHMKGAPFKFLGSMFGADKNIGATNEAKLIAEIMMRNNMLGDITESRVYGDDLVSKLFALQKGGEFLAQGTSTIAQLLHQKVELKDGTKTNLFKLHRLEKGRVVFDHELLPDDSPFATPDGLRKQFDIIKAVNEKIHGDYSHVLAGKKTAVGRALFLFRTWLPMAVKDRFGAEYTHRILGKQKGRYRSAWDLVTGIVYKPGEGVKFNGESALNLLRLVAKFVPGLNSRIQLTGEISELDRQNLQMFVREVQMLIMLGVGLSTLKAAADDEDKDGKKIAFMKFIHNQGERLQNELSMFAVPSSVSDILNNVIPLTNTLIDAEGLLEAVAKDWFTDNPAEYQSGFRKGENKAWIKFNKFLPGLRSYQSVWSSMSQFYSDSRNSR